MYIFVHVYIFISLHKHVHVVQSRVQVENKHCSIFNQPYATLYNKTAAILHKMALTTLDKRVVCLYSTRDNSTHLLSSEKDKYVSLYLLTDVDLDHCPDGGFEVISLRLWSIEDLNRMGPPRNTLPVCVCTYMYIMCVHCTCSITHTTVFSLNYRTAKNNSKRVCPEVFRA